MKSFKASVLGVFFISTIAFSQNSYAWKYVWVGADENWNVECNDGAVINLGHGGCISDEALSKACKDHGGIVGSENTGGTIEKETVK